MKIFLSHSSKDKPLVKRINDDLKSHDFITWLDSDDIPLGGSIVEFIERGLSESDIVMVFLSEHAVHSKWVQNEWQAKLFSHINENRIIIIPVLVNKCQIPKFLAHLKYADFTETYNYERNLSHLLNDLNQLKLSLESKVKLKNISEKSNSIYAYTREFLGELENEHIALPVHKRLPIIETLRKIPRSGKILRLRSFKPSIKSRSIYDHIISVSQVADILLPRIDHGIKKQEYIDLARCIAFHELNEVVLGDIPTYTPLLKVNSRNWSRIYAEQRIRSVEPDVRERIAHDFVWLFLNDRHRKSLETVNQILSDTNSRIRVIFKMLDKIDPIIATWRYLDFYRGKLGDSANNFTWKMKDFFENPDVKDFIRGNKLDSKILDLVINLQDRENACDYYKDSNKVFEEAKLFELPKEVIKEMIEGIPLFIDTKT